MNLPNYLKIRFFSRSSVLLRAIIGVPWKANKMDKEFCGKRQIAMETLRIRRLRFISHIWKRRKEEMLSKVLMREPKNGKPKRGRLNKTYEDQLRGDNNLRSERLMKIMRGRKKQKKLFNGVRAKKKLHHPLIMHYSRILIF